MIGIRNRGQERGLALLMVVWTVGILGIAAGQLSLLSQAGSRAAFDLQARAEGEALADGGVHYALYALATRDLLPLDGTPLPLALPGGRVEIAVQDHAGLLNVNQAEAEVLARLAEGIGLERSQAKALGAAIVNYRETGKDPNHGWPNNAASDPAGVKQGGLRTIEELQQVPGMDFALYRRMVPFLSLGERPSKIDPRVAPAAVLMAITGLDAGQVGSWLQQYDDVAERQASEEATLHTSTADMFLGADQTLQFNFGTSPTEAFNIRVTATTSDGAIFVRVAQVARARQNAFKTDSDFPWEFLAWSQGTLPAR